MHKKYYLLLDSSSVGVEGKPDATFNLQRHIPNGSKMRMLQFNWNCQGTVFDGDDTDNGMVITLNNVGNFADFRSSAPGTSLQSCCILAQIPQESLFVPASTTTKKMEGTYEPYNPCVVNISAPMTSLDISFKTGGGESMTDTKLDSFDYTLLLEIEEECGCQ